MPQTPLPNYPNHRTTVTLETHDGRQVRVRHMRQSDAILLNQMFYRLSSETRYRRFFVPLDHIDEERVTREAERLATIDPLNETALIAICDENDGEACVAVARYACFRNHPESCEGSIVVRDDFQGVGLGRKLFDLLIQVALAHDLQHMILLTHADNTGMIALVQRSGLPYKSRLSEGLYEIDLQLRKSEQPLFPFSNGGA